MKSQTRFLISAFLVLTAAFLVVRFVHTSTAVAQSADAPVTLPARWSYAAKFACGFEQSPTPLTPPNELPVVSGNYATVINIHNPFQGTVTLQKKVVVAFPERFPQSVPTNPTRRFPDQLASDHAMNVDCAEIVNLLTINGTPPAAPFIEGYVVIDSWTVNSAGTTTAVPVDVVEVTSASQNPQAPVFSHEVLTVAGRQLPAGTWPF
jgi:hypothetical protein